MGVPEEALGGHAFHTYRLASPDGTVSLVFKHNVVGRAIYADGTVDAVAFLARKIAQGAAKRVYTMADVLAESHVGSAGAGSGGGGGGGAAAAVPAAAVAPAPAPAPAKAAAAAPAARRRG